MTNLRAISNQLGKPAKYNCKAMLPSSESSIQIYKLWSWADQLEHATSILSLSDGIFKDWSFFWHTFSLLNNGSSAPVTQWRQLVSCDMSSHSHGSLIPAEFDLKINWACTKTRNTGTPRNTGTTRNTGTPRSTGTLRNTLEHRNKWKTQGHRAKFDGVLLYYLMFLPMHANVSIIRESPCWFTRSAWCPVWCITAEICIAFIM